MATRFSRTTRSLAHDGGRRTLVAWLAAGLLLAAWFAWFVFGRVTLYEVSRHARLEVQQSAHPVAALVPSKVAVNTLVLGQEVHAGDRLIELDAAPEKARLAEESTRLQAIVPRVASLRKEIAALEQAAARDQPPPPPPTRPPSSAPAKPPRRWSSPATTSGACARKAPSAAWRRSRPCAPTPRRSSSMPRRRPWPPIRAASPPTRRPAPFNRRRRWKACAVPSSRCRASRGQPGDHRAAGAGNRSPHRARPGRRHGGRRGGAAHRRLRGAGRAAGHGGAAWRPDHRRRFRAGRRARAHPPRPARAAAARRLSVGAVRHLDGHRDARRRRGARRPRARGIRARPVGGAAAGVAARLARLQSRSASSRSSPASWCCAPPAA